MIRARTRRSAVVILAFGFGLLLAFGLAGCGSKSANSTTSTHPTGATAKDDLPLAVSALATIAPDAKLLVVQTGNVVTATSTPVWSYLFGSPKSGKTYLVEVKDKKPSPVVQYGTAGLKTNEWALIPPTSDWKTDSNTAYATAVKAAQVFGDTAYTMGFLTHIPASDTSSTTKPMVWYVSFDPASNPATRTVMVDIKTGSILTK